MSVLELFSGTKSVGKVCDEIGWKTVSVDLILEADHKCDVMEFDYKQYPRDFFDVVWASPPCTAYSNLQNCWLNRQRNGSVFTKERMEEERQEADKLVLKTLEIIDYFKPSLWFIENPQTGQLRNRYLMKDIPFYDVDYCMYSDWGYKKRTRIWTNKEHFSPKLCDGKGSCGNMVEIQTDGAVHTGTRQPIKSETRIIHKNPIGDADKCKRAKKQLLHKTNLGNTERLQKSTKQMKHNDNCILKGKKQHKVALGVKDTEFQKNLKGGGTNRLERYRIPARLIHDLLIG